jgi:hypothetical protein
MIEEGNKAEIGGESQVQLILVSEALMLEALTWYEYETMQLRPHSLLLVFRLSLTSNLCLGCS